MLIQQSSICFNVFLIAKYVGPPEADRKNEIIDFIINR